LHLQVVVFLFTYIFTRYCQLPGGALEYGNSACISETYWPLSLLLYYCSLCIDHSLLFKYCYYLIHTISYFSINRLATGINIPCGITPQKAQ
jgi:hypothetical protein